MKFILVVFLSAIIAIALAEPLAYRQRPMFRTSARQTDNGGVALQAEFGDSTTPSNIAAKSDADQNAAAEPAPEQPAVQNGPYLPTGWRPLGQLLVLPFAVRENLDSTTTVETKSFNSNNEDASETTEETTTDASNDQQKSEVETSEPKAKKTAAYKKPPQKFVGQLKVKSKAGTVELKGTTDESTTTESDDEATTTEAQKEDLETTSEPESEAVDNAEKSNVDGQQSTNAQNPAAAAPQFPQTAYFIQLPDGSLQRIVYLQPQAPAQAAFLPQPTVASGNIQVQQLNQSPNYPFAFNPIANPKIVTFSSQYQAF